jgi:hypothetical protein
MIRSLLRNVSLCGGFLAFGLAQLSAQSIVTNPPPIITQTVPRPAVDLSEQDQLDLDTCKLVIADIQAAKDSTVSRKFSQELLQCSDRLAKAQPNLVDVWVWRGAAAMELNDPQVGWEAARNLRKLKVSNSSHEEARRVLAMLNRRGWLVENYADLKRAREQKASDLLATQREEAEKRTAAERAARVAEATRSYGWMVGQWEIDNWAGGPLELNTQWDRNGILDIKKNDEGRFVISGTATAASMWVSDEVPPTSYDQTLRTELKTFDPST